ncbi:Flp pilus assembly complex ATPase component TadA [bacterium]|nr:Flp pilus assembly complex ATPase component TadA [bacterium]
MIETDGANKTLERLKYDLVKEGLVEYETLEKAQELAAAQKINVGQALINSHVITEEALLKFLEAKLHLPYVNLDEYSLDERCLQYIKFADAKKYKIIPLFKIEDELTVAMADPFDLFAIDRIMELAECSIAPVISSEAGILRKIDEYYKTGNTVGEIFTDVDTVEFDWREELNSDDISEDHIQKIISAILKQAILENLHEISFTQEAEGLGVNFKSADNDSHRGCIPSLLMAPFVNKLKDLANLDASVSEVPQLGKLFFMVDGIGLYARISTFPTVMGERIALSIYKPPKELNQFIKDENSISIIKNSLKSPGITLICGSQLSGKTHVIYSLLNYLASSADDLNIMTIESISKYELPNINQCELNESIGFNLDKALKFIEFQSPDVIYFENIRNKDTLDYLSGLVFADKTIITEYVANNITELSRKMSYSDLATFKSLISCMIFIHSKDSIEVFDKETAQKYLA